MMPNDLDMITIVTAPMQIHCGILIQDAHESRLIAGAHMMFMKMKENNLIPWSYSLTCGYSLSVHVEEDILLHDVPCPCGDPSHFLIKYQIRPALDFLLRN